MENQETETKETAKKPLNLAEVVNKALENSQKLAFIKLLEHMSEWMIKENRPLVIPVTYRCMKFGANENGIASSIYTWFRYGVGLFPSEYLKNVWKALAASVALAAIFIAGLATLAIALFWSPIRLMLFGIGSLFGMVKLEPTKDAIALGITREIRWAIKNGHFKGGRAFDMPAAAVPDDAFDIIKDKINKEMND